MKKKKPISSIYNNTRSLILKGTIYLHNYCDTFNFSLLQLSSHGAIALKRSGPLLDKGVLRIPHVSSLPPVNTPSISIDMYTDKLL